MAVFVNDGKMFVTDGSYNSFKSIKELRKRLESEEIQNEERENLCITE